MNVICIVADDQPADTIQHMPYLDSDPEGSWVTFPNAINDTPICGPSRMTHFTGRYPHVHGVDTNPKADDQRAGGLDESLFVAPALRRRGWHTAHWGKYCNGYPWFSETGEDYTPAGWHDWHARAGGDYTDWNSINNGVRTTESTYVVDWNAASIASYVAAAPAPFLAFWSSAAPHQIAGSYPPATRHEGLSVPAWSRPSNFNETDISDKPTWLSDYAPTVLSTVEADAQESDRADAIRILRSLDEGIEDVMAALSSAGILDDTVIFYWTDNSNQFGIHRHVTKGTPYREALDMQLKVRWPGVASRTDDALVSTADIVPTILDIAGAAPLVSTDGMSLRRRILDGSANWRTHLPFSKGNEEPRQYGVGDYQGVLTADGWKYVKHITDGDEELYDLDADPYELANVASSNTAKVTELERARQVLFP